MGIIVSPVSGLPAAQAIRQELRRRRARPEVILHVDIASFGDFNARHGFAAGDVILRLLGRIAVRLIEEGERRDGFVGHLGGDDFVLIVPAWAEAQVAAELAARFADEVRRLFGEPLCLTIERLTRHGL
jgi:diguanylate cyclase (GGDEF)-like protein